MCENGSFFVKIQNGSNARAVQKQQDSAVTDDRTVAQQNAALGSAKLDAQAANTGETADTIDELQKQLDECTVVCCFGIYYNTGNRFLFRSNTII